MLQVKLGIARVGISNSKKDDGRAVDEGIYA